MTSPNCSILVARDPDVVWVRVTGRATFRESLALEAYLTSCVETTPPKQTQVDLSHCISMDSTFIGTLVKLSTGHVSRPGTACRAMSPSPECQELIRNMHLEQILTVTDDATDPPGPTQPLPEAPFDQRAFGQHALEAHEQLADAHDDNARIFGPIVKQLREELDQKDDADNHGEN